MDRGHSRGTYHDKELELPRIVVCLLRWVSFVLSHNFFVGITILSYELALITWTVNYSSWYRYAVYGCSLKIIYIYTIINVLNLYLQYIIIPIKEFQYILIISCSLRCSFFCLTAQLDNTTSIKLQMIVGQRWWRHVQTTSEEPTSRPYRVR